MYPLKLVRRRNILFAAASCTMSPGTPSDGAVFGKGKNFASSGIYLFEVKQRKKFNSIFLFVTFMLFLLPRYKPISAQYLVTFMRKYAGIVKCLENTRQSELAANLKIPDY